MLCGQGAIDSYITQVSHAATTCITCPARVQSHVSEAPFHQWRMVDGSVWTLFYRTDTGYLLRFPDLADFAVSQDGHVCHLYPVAGVSEPTLAHLYRNQVMPLALSRQSRLLLHASAVDIGNGAVAFLGESGRGKSTLAASFATNGHRFLTDDGLQLEKSGVQYLVQPSHPAIRLWEDSLAALKPVSTPLAPALDYTPKACLLADAAVSWCSSERPLCGMYVLGEGNTEAVSIEAVSGREAMILLLRNCFLLDIEEKAMLTTHFSQLSELAALPLFFRLDFPRRYDMLPAVRAAILLQHAVQTSHS